MCSKSVNLKKKVHLQVLRWFGSAGALELDEGVGKPEGVDGLAVEVAVVRGSHVCDLEHRLVCEEVVHQLDEKKEAFNSPILCIGFFILTDCFYIGL